MASKPEPHIAKRKLQKYIQQNAMTQLLDNHGIDQVLLIKETKT